MVSETMVVFRCGHPRTPDNTYGPYVVGGSAQCRVCRRASSRNWRKANPERKRETERQWERANPERVRENKRRSQLRPYGLSLEQYQALLTQQGGVCAICHRVNSDGRSLAVDHDHQTGEVRGLLCAPCNRILGLLETRVDAFLSYLGRK